MNKKTIEDEMEKRVENFQKAMKDPTKRLSRDSNVKHDVHEVDTQGFNPIAKIHVEDEDESVNEENPESPKS